MKKNKGRIILVGAGPGDPGLITVKGREAVKKAQVLVYDYLVHPGLTDYAPASCEKIYAGKKAGRHTMKQEEIESLMVRKAAEGKLVVRLKGGDPFVFGRGGEEALAAARAGIPFEVVPGVTAGIAVPSYAGIPVTHRGVASCVTFITGHEAPGKEQSGIDWAGLASGPGTLVFYMGAGRVGEIAGELMAHGAGEKTPAAVIHRGATEHQQTVSGTLADIEERVRKAGIEPPAVIVVGGVVGLRDRLNWFESLPLFGRSVLVTRAREQASQLTGQLKTLGARVIEMPAIRIGAGPEPEAVDKAIRDLQSYDIVIFTSVNGVKRFMNALRGARLDVRALGKKTSLCAIGPATEKELKATGLAVDLVADSFTAEAMVETLRRSRDLKDKKVLLPRAEKARRVLPEGLRGLGAVVDEVALYSTELEEPENLEQVRRDLACGLIDVVSFTSSSTVENFIHLVGREEVSALAGRVLYASIGPVTAETAARYGLEIAIMPERYTIDDLAGAICDYFSARKKRS